MGSTPPGLRLLITLAGLSSPRFPRSTWLIISSVVASSVEEELEKKTGTSPGNSHRITEAPRCYRGATVNRKFRPQPERAHVRFGSSRHCNKSATCPLYLRKQTSSSAPSASVSCQSEVCARPLEHIKRMLDYSENNSENSVPYGGQYFNRHRIFF